MIELAKDQVVLVTRFTNDLIINSLLKKANAGLKVKILADTKLVESFIRNSGDKISLDDKNKNERIKVVANPFYPSRADRKYVQVPFCLIIVDNKYIGMELADSYGPDKFTMAVFLNDPMISAEMMKLFDHLWQKSSTSPPQLESKTAVR
jgi:hypothetical protein